MLKMFLFKNVKYKMLKNFNVKNVLKSLLPEDIILDPLVLGGHFNIIKDSVQVRIVA